jgi:ABC-type enterochelin transport system permease subunit
VLSVITLSVMQDVTMLSVIMLGVIMPNVVAPFSKDSIEKLLDYYCLLKEKLVVNVIKPFFFVT